MHISKIFFPARGFIFNITIDSKFIVSSVLLWFCLANIRIKTKMDALACPLTLFCFVARVVFGNLNLKREHSNSGWYDRIRRSFSPSRNATNQFQESIRRRMRNSIIDFVSWNVNMMKVIVESTCFIAGVSCTHRGLTIDPKIKSIPY